MEEERRLCYVAITRAKQTLHISYARQRMLYGRTTTNLPSRFIDELPESCTVKTDVTRPERREYDSYGSYDRSAYRVSIYGDYEAPPARRPSVSARKDDSVLLRSQKTPAVTFSKGDMVQHKAFGRGLVLTVVPMGGDALIEVAFDGVGTKRLMANTASAHMQKL